MCQIGEVSGQHGRPAAAKRSRDVMIGVELNAYRVLPTIINHIINSVSHAEEWFIIVNQIADHP